MKMKLDMSEIQEMLKEKYKLSHYPDITGIKVRGTIGKEIYQELGIGSTLVVYYQKTKCCGCSICNDEKR